MMRFWVYITTAVLLSALPASALTISGVTISLGGDNTADDATAGGSSSNNTSEVSILNPGGTVADTVAATMTAHTRYASNLWADGSFGDTQASTTNAYDLTMSVSADPGVTYDITIDSLFRGVLNHVDDASFGEASASVSAVTVFLDSVVSVPHSTNAQLIALDYYDESLTFSQTGTNTLTALSGTTNLVFEVEWTSLARSFSDEAAVLLGLDEAGGPEPFVTVGEYAEFPGRNLNDDGHFIEITATVTEVAAPEPGLGVLLTAGVAVIAMGRRRR